MQNSKRFLLCLALAVSTAHGQSLTLDEARSEGMKDSPELARAKSAYEEASWRKVETYSGFLPTITANGNYLAQKKYVFTNVKIGNSPDAVAIPGIVPTSSMNILAQIPIFDGFASTNRLRSAQSYERAMMNENDWARFQTERSISLNFYRALAAKTIESVYAENLKTLEDHLREARLFKRAGTSTNFDVLRAEVQVSQARSELMNATDNVAIAKGNLTEIIGHQTDNRDIEGVLPVLHPSLVNAKDFDGSQLRKDLIALQEKVQSLDYQESAASRYFVPKVSLFGQYQFYNNLSDRFDDTSDYRNAYQFGINMVWNIFDGMSSIAKSKQSIEQHVQAESVLRREKLKSTSQVNIWKRKFLHNCSLYEARLDDVKKSKESVRLSRSGQKVGAQTNTDVLDAVSELQHAQAGVVNAQLGAIEALIQLELATGEKIYDFH